MGGGENKKIKYNYMNTKIKIQNQAKIENKLQYSWIEILAYNNNDIFLKCIITLSEK